MKHFSALTAIVVAACMLSTSVLQAQTYGGAVLDHDIMMPSNIASLSQNQTFGTARSMAMGGAFTSLGGDIASVGINPAGLGMFSHEVISFTPMLSTAAAETMSSPSWVGNNKTSFGFANMGATFNLAQRAKGSLISLTAAIAYNRLADYNTQMSYSSESLYDPSNGNLVPSIIDVYGSQLAGASIYPDSDGSMSYDNNPYYWNAQEAYMTYMLDPTSDNSGWGTNTLGHNASIMSSYEVEQRGRSDEYLFALGGNVGNYLYFGATFSLQEISQTTKYSYQEEYGYFADGDGGYAYASADSTTPLDSQADYTYIWQETSLSGSGANLKLGLIARPTRALRIGAAFHTPTYYTLARSYQTYTETLIVDNSDDSSTRYSTESPLFIDNYEYSWKFRTPAKLLLGASYQVGNFGILSLDYERQWYNWIRVSNAPGDLSSQDYKTEYQEYYKPTSTIRAGLEVKPIPTVALRVGGGTTSSMIKDESLCYGSPTPTDSYYVTCGVGFQFSASTSLDLAYQFYHQNYTSYYLFYTEDADGNFTGSNMFDSSLKRNFISATLTIRI